MTQTKKTYPRSPGRNLILRQRDSGVKKRPNKHLQQSPGADQGSHTQIRLSIAPGPATTFYLGAAVI